MGGSSANYVVFEGTGKERFYVSEPTRKKESAAILRTGAVLRWLEKCWCSTVMGTSTLKTATRT